MPTTTATKQPQGYDPPLPLKMTMVVGVRLKQQNNSMKTGEDVVKINVSRFKQYAWLLG